ncbi:PIN-like domain-containing protein [Oceanobacillus salinisoli]|uniref:PIN-like domain-containing protein n=1 Tax=Oceanobacillus salinisoli TaxID=2678611 RepID=UPI0012E138DE|nr:PIN domain-containing protein [Oceanobacillus salinisoli]
MDKFLKMYLPKNKDDVKNIWDNALIIVDTNILLNLYKYSDSTRDEFFSVIKSMRTWIPHQVAIEYLLNRSTKIQEQEENFKNQVKAIKESKELSVKHIDEKINVIKKPFRKIELESIKNKIEEFFNSLKNEIEEGNKDNVDFSEHDVILSNFIEIYSDRIGPAYEKDQLDTIYQEGKERYSNEFPPGYEDLEDKKGQYKMYKDTKIKSEYGDLILWKQIIDKAKDDNEPIIFVTDDRKKDWWKIEKGQLKGPREELINEFMKETNNDFLMYSTESFLKNAKDILAREVKESAIKEVHDYSKLKEQIASHIYNLYENETKEELPITKSLIEISKMNYYKDKEKYKDNLTQLNLIEEQIHDYSEQLSTLNFELNNLSLNPYEKDDYNLQIEKLQRKVYSLIIEKRKIEKELGYYNGKMYHNASKNKLLKKRIKPPKEYNKKYNNEDN